MVRTNTSRIGPISFAFGALGLVAFVTLGACSSTDPGNGTYVDPAASGGDGDASDGSATGDACPTFIEPPLTPDGCGPGVDYIPAYDTNGCKTGYTCPADAGGADAGGDGGDAGDKVTCAEVNGTCVDKKTTKCPFGGHLADEAKVSCEAVGAGCCVVCPELAPPSPEFCDPDESVPVATRNEATDCVTGFHCGFALTEKDDGRTVSVTKAGTSITVTLESFGAGTTWTITDKGSLDAPHVTTVVPSGDLVGTQTFTFSNVPTADTHGTFEVKFVYGKPGAAPTKTFSFYLSGKK